MEGARETPDYRGKGERALLCRQERSFRICKILRNMITEKYALIGRV